MVPVKEFTQNYTCHNCNNKFTVHWDSTGCPHCGLEYDQSSTRAWLERKYVANKDTPRRKVKSASRIGDSMVKTGNSMMGCGCALFMLGGIVFLLMMLL